MFVGTLPEALRLPRDQAQALAAKTDELQANLLGVKDDMERALQMFQLDCQTCGKRVAWVRGLGFDVGRWAHEDPAPHGEPAV